MRLTAAILLIGSAAFTCIPAFAVYKCESAGRTTYSDLPCPEGKVTEVAATAAPGSSDAEDRASAEKDSLKRLEKERHQREAIDARERKRGANASAVRRKRCDKLALRQKRALDDVAASVGKANEKAKLKARRITEDYEAACGRWYEREMNLAY